MRRRALSVLAIAAVLAVAGCGSAGTEQSVAPGGEASSEPALPAIENDRGPRAYRDLVDRTFTLLADYWDNQLPDLGAKPGVPKRLVSYWSRSEDPGCSGQPAGARNAQYCARTETIAWDGNWVYGRLYRAFGSAAVSFLLAHEYAHFVQDRLGIDRRFPLTIEGELNADCLAGAWLGVMDRKVERFDDVDFGALAAGILNVADPRGVPWANPTAHGRADERRRALSIGARKGQRACLRQLGPGFSR